MERSANGNKKTDSNIMRKNSYLTVTDQFCGAGGSSQGVRNCSNKIGGGVEVKLAMNHWALAIDTHNTNFPDALHDCADISASDPRRYPSTDVLVTSPECTNQTGANGKKKPKAQLDLFIQQKLDPAEERSRATMWDVPRFAEYHGYNLIYVENVVEAKKWVQWDAWILAMHLLGYNHECVFRNSMHFYPCPQSRDRMYVVFWKKGNPKPDLDYRPKAFCQECGHNIDAKQTWKRGQKSYKYKRGYVYTCPVHHCIVEPYYYAAFNIIDWSNKGRRIGDIKLVEPTMERIRYGIDKYWSEDSTIPTLPFLIKTEYNNKGRSIIEALSTQCARQTMGIVLPLITDLHSGGKTRTTTEALSTITSGGIKNGLITDDSFHSFIAYYNGQIGTSHILEPAGTITTVDRLALVNYTQPNIEDCYYRTLKAHEVKIGMAFDENYIVKGNQKEQVKQCGNAVTPPVMEYLIGQGIKTLM